MSKLDVVYVSDTGHVVGVVSRAGPAPALPDGTRRLQALVGDELVVSINDSAAGEQGEFALDAEWLSHVEIELEDDIADVLLRPLDWMAVLPSGGSTAPPTEILRNTRTLTSLSWSAASQEFTATFSSSPEPAADTRILFIISEGSSTRRVEQRYIVGQDTYSTHASDPAVCLVLAAGGFHAILKRSS